jgi:hypothetical protein
MTDMKHAMSRAIRVFGRLLAPRRTSISHLPVHHLFQLYFAKEISKYMQNYFSRKKFYNTYTISAHQGPWYRHGSARLSLAAFGSLWKRQAWNRPWLSNSFS